MASRRAEEPVHDIFLRDPSPTLPSSPQGASTDAGAGTARLASGRSVEWQTDEDGVELVKVRGVKGEIELDVVLTDDGPRLRFKAASLALEADGKVQVDCDEFHVRAASRIIHESDGDLGERIAGNAISVVQGNLRMSARTAGVRATRGDVRLKANDDVRLTGERIKLNC